MKDKSKRKVSLSELSEMTYDWSEIRHFFIWRNRLIGKNYLIFINKYGGVQTMRVEGKGAYQKYRHSWEQWNAEVSDRPLPSAFFFPQWIEVKEVIHTLSLDVALKCGVLLLLTMLLFGSQYRGGLLAAIIFLVTLLGLMLPHLLSLIRGKRPLQISIGEDALKVAFCSGVVREFKFDQLQYYCFDPHLMNSFAVFTDGTR